MNNIHLKHGYSCPRCDSGVLIQKVNKDYQPFLSCDSFPYCKFACNLTQEEYTKYINKNESRTTKQDKTADWIRLRQGNEDDRDGILEEHNNIGSKGKTYLPAV